MKKTILGIGIIGMMILSNSQIQAQCDALTHARTAGYYVGWDGTNGSTGTLDIMNKWSSQSIKFSLGGTPTLYLELKSTGDLDLSTAAKAYMINGNKMLWHGGNTYDIFLGVGAGNATMTGHGNTFLGNSAGATQTTGSGCTFVGNGAGANTSDGTSNTFIGAGAGSTAGYPGNSNGGYNTIVGGYAGQVSGNHGYGKNSLFGYNAGQLLDDGWNNVLIGYQSGANLANANNNIFIGYQSGMNDAISHENVGIGYEALKTQNYGTTLNTYNVALGNGALFTNNPTSSTTGINNTALGHNALYSNTTGYNNTASGFKAGYFNQTGSANSFVGYAAGNGVSGYSNSNNSLFGYKAGYAVTTGSNNIFIGYGSGIANSSGGNNLFIGYQAGNTVTTVSDNVFIGYNSGYSNSSGTPNTCIGQSAGYYNATGSYNTAAGFEAGKGVTGNSYSYNTYYGYRAGYLNTTGQKNVFLGMQTGYNSTANYGTFVGYNAGAGNTSGAENTYFGYGTGYSNSTSAYNTCVGSLAGYQNTGEGNTFVGKGAGYSNTTGIANTFVGYSANANGQYNYSGSFGYNATTTATNRIYLGDANATLYCALGYWSGSDGRFKNNVKEDVKGLEFINKLRPVTYQFDTKLLTEHLTQNMPDSIRNNYINNDFTSSKSVIRSGFIAQEVEQAGIDAGFNSDIVHAPENDIDHYGLNYSEIVVPLVKAVQELSKTQDSLMAEIATLKGAGQRNNNGDNTQGKAETNLQVELANNGNAILYQNEPNPFDGSTVIRYFIPENITGSAYVGFYDTYGKEIKKLEITERGFGKIDASTENLAAGIYSYSIVVDEKIIDTKKMLKTK